MRYSFVEANLRESFGLGKWAPILEIVGFSLAPSKSKDGGPVMAQLPVKAQRHPWLRYQVKGYTKEIVNDFEKILDTIFNRHVNRVHILDFEGLTVEMRPDLADRLRMVYTGAEGQFILALGLHTAKEMAGDGFEAYWLISFSISGRAQAPEKVTATDLFYLRSMDDGMANVPCLLAQYLFRYAEERKRGARMFGGHFVGRLAEHFGLVSDEGLMGLTVIAHESTIQLGVHGGGWRPHVAERQSRLRLARQVSLVEEVANSFLNGGVVQADPDSQELCLPTSSS
ncbi:hypothetical protein Tco_0245414 [Tanacetum coccineum]